EMAPRFDLRFHLRGPSLLVPLLASICMRRSLPNTALRQHIRHCAKKSEIQMKAVFWRPQLHRPASSGCTLGRRKAATGGSDCYDKVLRRAQILLRSELWITLLCGGWFDGCLSQIQANQKALQQRLAPAAPKTTRSGA